MSRSVARPPGKSFIPVDLFIGDREHRSQEGLCHRLSLRPASEKRRIAIIEDADFLNEEGANCLLKTLEEPPPGSVLILIGTSQQRQLPTIRSRCQVIRFRRLSDEIVRITCKPAACRAASSSSRRCWPWPTAALNGPRNTPAKNCPAFATS